MPISPQPSGRRGTVGHPYSALNLRLALASFGLVTSAVFAAALLWAGLDLLGWIFMVFAAIAVVDMVVIQRRRRARRRIDGDGHSLFE
ncbi:MAG TPA: hypothetical protein VFO77_03980 [Actinoplanes sp.]|nr:hypothetical protein [Actinoplanes sp.]